METYVGLFRNGFCVVKDLLPTTHWLMQPLVGPVTQIECMIAPLQFAAILYNLSASAGKMWAAASYYVFDPVLSDEQWAQALSIGSAATAAKASAASLAATAYATDELRRNGEERRHNVRLGVCKGVLIFLFTALTFNSVHMSQVLGDLAPSLAPYYLPEQHNSFINWVLVCAEMALTYFLASMVAGVLAELRAAADKRRLADAVQSAGKDAASLLSAPAALPHLRGAAGELPAMPTAPWCEPSWKLRLQDPFGLAATKEYLAQLEKANATAAQALAAKPAAIEQELRVQADTCRHTALLDATLTLLNFLAFLGYGAFPVTFLTNETSLQGLLPLWPGHDLAQFRGNLLGDVAWTIEPFLILTMPLLINSAARKRRAAAAARAQKTK